MQPSAKSRTAAKPAGDPKTVNLALQGGGAQGAFCWGVLDRLLEDGRLAFEGISATSAGAMNAVVMASGWLRGGSDGAREALAGFWHAVSQVSTGNGLWDFAPWAEPLDEFSLDHSPGYLMLDTATRVFSPYQLNPFNFNPVRELLEAHVDFAALRRASPFKLFLAATNVETCKVRIFASRDVTADAVLASACLPFLFQAVRIDGQYYWDGGYLGNPAIFPLIYDCDSADVVIVHLNPVVRPGCPRTPGEILNRLNEVSFNSSLMREMRAIAFVTSLIDRGKLAEAEFKRMRIHAIRADELMVQHGASSRFNAAWHFLTRLRDEGRALAERWLAESYARIGRASTVDVRAEFL
jgi:NTE family protein